MRFCALASGSSGNCIYVGNDETSVLVDAGISAKRIEEGLNNIGVSPQSISAILVTHDHSDHTSGAAVFAKRFESEVYGTEATLKCIAQAARGGIPKDRYHSICADQGFTIGSIHVNPFRVSHDAKDPVGYTLSSDGRKLAMATDLGVFTDYTVENLKGADALYIEANHNVNMLMMGPYPYILKQRINSSGGHLSNEDCAELVIRVQNDHLKNIVLAHISKENNFEELAYETVRVRIEQDWNFEELPNLMVARRDTHSDMIEL